LLLLLAPHETVGMVKPMNVTIRIILGPLSFSDISPQRQNLSTLVDLEKVQTCEEVSVKLPPLGHLEVFVAGRQILIQEDAGEVYCRESV
jgi:hypothetical protein